MSSCLAYCIEAAFAEKRFRIMLWVWIGRSFRPDNVVGEASILSGRMFGSRRPNGPAGNTVICTEIKIKNRRSHLLEQLLFPHPFLNQLTTPALQRPQMQRHAALCPSTAACFPVSPPQLTTRRRVLRADTA